MPAAVPPFFWRIDMSENAIKAAVCKAFKNSSKELEPGSYELDTTITIHVSGTVVKCESEMVAPTHRIPFLSVIALVLEKSGITRDAATRFVREALIETMADTPESRVDALEERIKDVAEAVSTVKKQVIDQLPRVPKSGKFLANAEVQLLGPLEPTAEEKQEFLRNAVLAKMADIEA